MARKVIIDCDPGIDDAIALCLALFDPRLEVVAVTAAAGNVPAEQASRNVQTTIERLDPPRYPRVGSANSWDHAVTIDARHMHGDDGLGNAGFAVSQLHHQHPSDKVITDEVRAAPDEVTIICLGPMTNVAQALQREPGLETMVDRIIMSGGSINGLGNVTPAAEFNVYCDPTSARAVFRSKTTKTLIPLDVTQKVKFTLDFVESLPPEDTRAGAFLRRILPFAFRAYRQFHGQESIYLYDVVALVAALHPELFETVDMAGDVETGGDVATGATIFDRRAAARWLPNMEVAQDIDVAGVMDAIVRGLAEAGRST